MAKFTHLQFICALEAILHGKSISQVAKAAGVSRQTLHKRMKQQGYPEVSISQIIINLERQTAKETALDDYLARKKVIRSNVKLPKGDIKFRNYDEFRIASQVLMLGVLEKTTHSLSCMFPGDQRVKHFIQELKELRCQTN